MERFHSVRKGVEVCDTVREGVKMCDGVRKVVGG